MSRLQWRDWFEAVGIVAIVASLIFVGLQLRQTHDLALSQGNIENLAAVIALNDAINNNAEIWVRGNAGDDLDDSEAAVYRNLVINKHQFAWATAVRTRRMGLHVEADATIADFVGYLYDNPGALRVWNAREELYDRNRGFLAPDIRSGATYENEIRLKLEELRDHLEHRD